MAISAGRHVARRRYRLPGQRLFLADSTGDYFFEFDFDGSTEGFCGDASLAPSSDSSSVQAFLMLANAYVDLGTYNGFTPYSNT